MALTSNQCSAFNDLLGRRPYDWDKRVSKDRKPHHYIYAGMYRQEKWPLQMGTTHMHERVYVSRPNNPGLWTQFIADPCVGTPCDTNRTQLAHGVDQLRYDRFRQDFVTPVFCIDQLNTVEEGIQKMAAIAEGYQELPEVIASDFYRLLCLRKAGTAAQNNSGLWLSGVSDSSGNPVAIDVTDTMFAVSAGQSLVNSKNSLLINLNVNGGLTALGITTTAGLASNLGMLTMEYLANMQEDLAGNGYHDKDWLVEGKFSVTVDQSTRRRLLVANPALTQMYSAADFAKGGAFYSYGVKSGCGDWLFKEDKMQMRFRFRGDMDGKDFSGNAVTNAIWIEQVWPFENLAATFGIKPVFSAAWKKAPIRMFHVYNGDARIAFVGDIGSVNDEMKFGLARSFMGQWKWYSPDVIISTDPNTGASSTCNNEKHNKGYWLGEFDLGLKTIYPEIERIVLALGEPQPYVRTPTTNAPSQAPTSTTDYQSLLSYSTGCNNYVNTSFSLPIED